MKHLSILAICMILAVTARSQIGPFEISNNDGSAKLRFAFAGQLRTQYENRDAGSKTGRTEKLFSEARRIRLTLSGIFTDYNLGFKLHLSLAPGSIELMDAYFNYKFRQQTQLRIGQYKTPFTRYRIQSFQRLTFADWAIVTKYFGSERQIGAALHNGYETPPRMGYAIGVFTGVNARSSHATGLAGIYGEEISNPSDLADPGPKAEYHPEIFLHISLGSNNISIKSDTDEKRDDLRYFAAISAAWDIDPDDYLDLYLRLAPEFLLKYRGASLTSIGYIGFVKTVPDNIVKPGMSGILLQSSYRINDKFELSCRYAIIDFDDKLADDAFERARAILDLADDNDSDIIDQYKNAGKILREEELTAGFNIYLAGHSIKMQNDAGWLKHTRRNETRKDLVIRSQFQLTF